MISFPEFVQPPEPPRRIYLSAPRLARALAAMPPDRPSRIEVLAAAAGLSRAQFARAFKAQVGLTPARFARRQRLKSARQALEETSLPIVAIALQHGFADQPAFSRAFRLEFGLTPMEARRASTHPERTHT